MREIIRCICTSPVLNVTRWRMCSAPKPEWKICEANVFAELFPLAGVEPVPKATVWLQTDPLPLYRHIFTWRETGKSASGWRGCVRVRMHVGTPLIPPGIRGRGEVVHILGECRNTRRDLGPDKISPGVVRSLWKFTYTAVSCSRSEPECSRRYLPRCVWVPVIALLSD